MTKEALLIIENYIYLFSFGFQFLTGFCLFLLLQGGSQVFLGRKSLNNWDTVWAQFNEIQRFNFSWSITNRNTWKWRWCFKWMEWMTYGWYIRNQRRGEHIRFITIKIKYTVKYFNKIASDFPRSEGNVIWEGAVLISVSLWWYYRKLS